MLTNLGQQHTKLSQGKVKSKVAQSPKQLTQDFSKKTNTGLWVKLMRTLRE